MAKKAIKASPVKEQEAQIVPEKEVLEEGVVRDEAKQNPMDLVNSTQRVRTPGNWRKASLAEVADLEAKGLLLGWDPATSEVLIKEA